MVLYWGKQLDVEQVGGRVVRVECAKCGCEYFYELTRIGTGNATALYGIGVARATQSAQEQSKLDVGRRLATEAELVPCPKCNWINDDLVQGYRRGRYRRLGSLAFAVGVVGIFVSLIAAWFISAGPGADRAAVPYCLFGGPMLFGSLAIAMIVFRSGMRSRIQPNRDFPLEPNLPPGSPPALVWDESRENLVTVKPGAGKDRFNDDWHDFQFGRDRFPPVCCVCLKGAPSGSGYKRPITATFQLEIPLCEDCARHTRRDFRRVWSATTLAGLLAGIATAMLLRLETAESWMLIGSAAVTSAAFGSFIASTLTAPVKITVVDAARCIIRLRFRNPEFVPLIGADAGDSGSVS